MRWDHPQRGMVGPDDVHPDRRALRPDRRDGQLADRRGLPPGRRVARRGPAACASRSTSRRTSCATPDLADRIDMPRCAPRHQPAAAHLRDHRVGGDGRRVERDPHGRAARARSASTSRSTTSAPATRAWPTCGSCRAGELKIDRSFVLDLETSADARAVVDARRQAGARARPEGRRRGRRDRGAARDPALARLPRAAGLPVRPADVGAGAARLWAMDDDGPRALEFRDSLYRATVAGALH